MMSGIRGRNTLPERALRSELHRAGFRFRTHPKNLPGHPDIVFPRFRAVVFVHGCFWHGHDCHLYRTPGTRTSFWTAKIERNRRRDLAVRDLTLSTGWRHLAVWECAFRDRYGLPEGVAAKRVAAWLRGSRKTGEIRGRRIQ
jgi:DNA mismatch endonuclease (patch repair protein)